jgi:acetyl esterase/lipase
MLRNVPGARPAADGCELVTVVSIAPPSLAVTSGNETKTSPCAAQLPLVDVHCVTAAWGEADHLHHQADGCVGNGVVEHVGGVADSDAELACRVDVDRVVAGSLVHDGAEVGQRLPAATAGPSPPLVTFTSTHDIHDLEERDFVARARDAGIPLDYHEEPGGQHVYPLWPTAEGASARTLITALIDTNSDQPRWRSSGFRSTNKRITLGSYGWGEPVVRGRSGRTLRSFA